MAAAGLQALRPRSKPVRQHSVIRTEHRDDRPHLDFCLHLGGAVFKPLMGVPWHMKRGMRLQRKRDCVIWKEKHPAWINQQPYYQYITWLNRDDLPCRFTTFDRYDYGEKTVCTYFRWSWIGHPKSNREKIVVFCAYESRSKTATFSRGKTIFAGRKRVFFVIHEQSRSKHLAHYLIVTYSLLYYR